MVVQTKAAPEIRDKQNVQLNIELLASRAQLDWQNHPVTKEFIASIEQLEATELTNAISTLDQKHLHRAHAIREILKLARNHNSNKQN